MNLEVRAIREPMNNLVTSGSIITSQLYTPCGVGLTNKTLT